MNLFLVDQLLSYRSFSWHPRRNSYFFREFFQRTKFKIANHHFTLISSLIELMHVWIYRSLLYIMVGVRFHLHLGVAPTDYLLRFNSSPEPLLELCMGSNWVQSYVKKLRFLRRGRWHSWTPQKCGVKIATKGHDHLIKQLLPFSALPPNCPHIFLRQQVLLNNNECTETIYMLSAVSTCT